MPDIPRVPGVPALTSFATLPVFALVADLVAAVSSLLGIPRWGIFLNGSSVIEYQSFVTFNYRRDNSIADYPVQQGGFQSYDKVAHPFELRVRLSSGPSGPERQLFLTQLDELERSLELYDVVAPEKVYTSVNVSHVDLHRTATNGVGMIVADIWFQEIRETSTATFTNTQQPGIAGQQGVGNVQPKTPPDNVQNNFDVGSWF